MKIKHTLLLPLIAICWIIATLTYCANAQAAGPATNVVTLYWTPPTNSLVPFVYEIQQTLSLAVPNPIWTTIAANIPATQTNLLLTVDKDLKLWRMRQVNATNSAWVGDFGPAVSTLWPSQGGGLGIRLGQ